MTGVLATAMKMSSCHHHQCGRLCVSFQSFLRAQHGIEHTCYFSLNLQDWNCVCAFILLKRCTKTSKYLLTSHKHSPVLLCALSPAPPSPNHHQACRCQNSVYLSCRNVFNDWKTYSLTMFFPVHYVMTGKPLTMFFLLTVFFFLNMIFLHDVLDI